MNKMILAAVFSAFVSAPVFAGGAIDGLRSGTGQTGDAALPAPVKSVDAAAMARMIKDSAANPGQLAAFKAIFQKGKPATREQVLGWHAGKGAMSLIPDSVVGTLLASRDDLDGGQKDRLSFVMITDEAADHYTSGAVPADLAAEIEQAVAEDHVQVLKFPGAKYTGPGPEAGMELTMEVRYNKDYRSLAVRVALTVTGGVIEGYYHLPKDITPKP
jgi:hypothetical protein